MKLDIIAFGAHPDDVEIGMGATLAKYALAGYSVGICDLTKAELSSNGTVELRQKEAEDAATILGLTKRIQLDFADRGLRQVQSEKLSELVSVIRQYEPSIIFSPYEVDRHPDHGACTVLVKEAIFNAGIRKYRCKSDLPAYRPDDHHLYFINGYEKPDFLIDVSDCFKQKIEALQAYKSQFIKSEESVETPLTNGYVQVVEARDRLFGRDVGVVYAEGFMTTKSILMTDLFAGKEKRR